MVRWISLLGWAIPVAIVVGLVAGGSPFALYIAGLVMIYAISALGLDWIQGRAGQVSIGSAAFMAIGAYVAATAAGFGLPYIVVLPLAGLAGAAAGFLVGLPALRLRGLYLALSTLALQFITYAFALQYETMAGKSAGFFVPPATIGPFQLQQGRVYTIFLAVVLAAVMIGLRNLYRAAPGRAWLAIKESEISTAVIGISPTRWKLSAFLASSALISVSGALLAYYTLRVFSDTYSLQFALTFVVMVIIGGLGSIGGVLAGATLVTVLPYVLSGITGALPQSLPITDWLSNNVYYINNGLYGVLVLLFLLFQPRGIAGLLDSIGRRLTDRSTPPTSAGPLSEGTRYTESGQPSDAILQIRDLRLVYRSGACALEGVDLAVRPGEVVALLGRNGAGKTSTLRAVSGFFVADKVTLTGSLRFKSVDILGAPPTRTAREGIILVPERDKVFSNLTVAEHLRMCGNRAKSRRSEVLELFPALRTRLGTPAGLLSGGERQMLALAMAWCLEPQLLLIDELSLGLAPAVVKRLMSTVRSLSESSQLPILLVEQNVSAAQEIADRVYILEAGRIVSAGTPAQISREGVLSTSLGVV
jgi:branched-chain amino acid transport system permease protein